MSSEDIILILRLATLLAQNFIGGETVKNILALEEMAATVARAYQQEVGRPIDPDKFKFEPPLSGDGGELQS